MTKLTIADLESIARAVLYEVSEDAGRTFDDVYGEAETPEEDRERVVVGIAKKLPLSILAQDVIDLAAAWGTDLVY